MNVPTGDALATKAGVAQPVSDEPSPEEQTRLAQRCCLGDRSAFAALVTIWEHRLLTIAYRVVGSVHDAEEVRQIVLLKLAKSPPKLDDPSRFAGWLRRCAVNEAVTWLRHRHSETRRRETFDGVGLDVRPTPPERAAAAERSQRLQEALRELDPEWRAMLSLRFDEGMTIRQIAETLERPPMTVHGQIARALERLREQLSADDGEGRI
jgi:RNA polymerase sigma-70 factor, ECF subfamily